MIGAVNCPADNVGVFHGQCEDSVSGFPFVFNGLQRLSCIVQHDRDTDREKDRDRGRARHSGRGATGHVDHAEKGAGDDGQ